MRSLEEARSKLSLSQSDMAKRLNVSVSTIKNWEQCQKCIESIKLIKIAKSYEMTNYELLQYINNIKKN